ncbi:hypothetical protein ACIBG8_34075 [Nonomuraea sp. NPDC050556]|uniref:hypothetical protein n=1 Tax=Nonomuraea sp. NPDC050556 TaxID=3364369 RepID=UPI00379E3EA9
MNPSPANGVKVTPLLLSGVMAVVVLMLFTVVFLLTRAPEPVKKVAAVTVPTASEEPTQSAEPSQEAVPTGEARFTTEADPCALVDEDLQKKYVLYPDKSQIYREECEWQSLPRGAQLPDNMGFRLKVYVKVFTEGLGKAHEQYLARRADATLLPKKYNDAGIGDASYSTVWTLPGDTGRGPTTATVGVRLSNAVIEVSYERRVDADPEGRLTKGALEVAKAVADKVGA